MVLSAFAQSVRSLMEKFGVDAPDIRVNRLTLDSREVGVNTAFVAIKGHALDGRDFIPQAISLGAPVIFAQTEERGEHGTLEMRNQTVIIHLFDLPQMVSALAAAFFDFPANKLSTIAVTGTNGKTSTVNLCTQLKHRLGWRAAAIGTLGSAIYQVEKTQWQATPAATTTPDAIHMQYLLADYVQQDVAQVAFEASSHALVQGRLGQVNTDIAIFTNLSRDHLDYHGSMSEYAAAKRLLLKQPGLHTVIVNIDDPESKNWLAQSESLEQVVTSTKADASKLPQSRYCYATNLSYDAEGTGFTLQTSWGTQAVRTRLLGEFNVANLLAAIAAMLVQGEAFSEVCEILPDLQPVPGRMEVFSFASHANVVVDYAHTPDALAQALAAVKLHAPGKLWCVFGCGGDRDKGKRPQMGAAAEEQADRIVITTDNSRSEDPAAIVDDILQGLKNPKLAVLEADREQAISYCLREAAENDMILVAGKGHEDYQLIGKNKKNYNERAVIARLQRETEA